MPLIRFLSTLLLISLLPGPLAIISDDILTLAILLIRIQLLIIHLHIAWLLTNARLKPLLSCSLKTIVVFLLRQHGHRTSIPEIELYLRGIGCLDRALVFPVRVRFILNPKSPQLPQPGTLRTVDVNCVTVVDVLKQAHVLVLADVAEAERAKYLVKALSCLGLVARVESDQGWQR